MEKNIEKKLSYVFTGTDWDNIKQMIEDKDYNGVRSKISVRSDMYKDRMHYIRNPDMESNIKMVQINTILDSLEDYFINLTEEQHDRKRI